jgi:hypothetical protein
MRTVPRASPRKRKCSRRERHVERVDLVHVERLAGLEVRRHSADAEADRADRSHAHARRAGVGRAARIAIASPSGPFAVVVAERLVAERPLDHLPTVARLAAHQIAHEARRARALDHVVEAVRAPPRREDALTVRAPPSCPR